MEGISRVKWLVTFLGIVNCAEIYGFMHCDQAAFFLDRRFRLQNTPLFAKKMPRSGKKTNKKTGSKGKPKQRIPPDPDASPQKKRTKKASTPPWQVMSASEAKKNVANEKERRKKAQLGIQDHSNNDGGSHTLSKDFLSDELQRIIKWTRFNPINTPVGMQFVGSYLDKRLPPRLGVPEIAFLGRSNVGKSSLLNRLSSSARKSSSYQDQARVGKTPGATASVNMYALMDAKDNRILGWADLPGFGYAKLSKEVKESVQLAAENYLDRRRELALGILLVDIRREPSVDDQVVLAALFDMGVPIVVVATKMDKLKVNEREACLANIQKGLGLPDGQPLPVSSVTGEGIRSLWKIILEACEDSVAQLASRYEPGGKEGENEYSQFDTFDDADDLVYDQGYNWMHNSDVGYEDNDILEGDGDEEDYMWENDLQEEDEVPIPTKRETLKSLRAEARAMQRKGDL